MKKRLLKLKIFSTALLISLSAVAQNQSEVLEESKHPLEGWVQETVRSLYETERVASLARSVTFPGVLNQGQAIIDTKYPNAAIFCLDVANYGGLVTGLIWSMDRELVEEYDLHYLIDQASVAFFTCVGMFMPPELLKKIIEQSAGQGVVEPDAETPINGEGQPANPDNPVLNAFEKEAPTPQVSIKDARAMVISQIEKIQKALRFAQTVQSQQKK